MMCSLAPPHHYRLYFSWFHFGIHLFVRSFRSFPHHASCWMGCYSYQEIFSFQSSLSFPWLWVTWSENEKSDNFCQKLETISSVLPWISPGETIYPSFWPSMTSDMFYFSFESIDLFIFWSKLSPSSNQHPSTNCLWRIGFSRHSICSVKVYFYFDFLYVNETSIFLNFQVWPSQDNCSKNSKWRASLRKGTYFDFVFELRFLDFLKYRKE